MLTFRIATAVFGLVSLCCGPTAALAPFRPTFRSFSAAMMPRAQPVVLVGSFVPPPATTTQMVFPDSGKPAHNMRYALMEAVLNRMNEHHRRHGRHHHYYTETEAVPVRVSPENVVVTLPPSDVDIKPTTTTTQSSLAKIDAQKLTYNWMVKVLDLRMMN